MSLQSKHSRLQQLALALTPLLGCLYVAYLLMLPREGVFYSGDAGVKLLLVEQFEKGKITPELTQDKPPEVQAIWRDGLYPFREPFVYMVGEQPVVSFPLYFPLVTAPFHTLLGWRGLYVLPALGLLLTWVAVLAALRICRLRVATSLLVLIALIFSSPLTLYAGMFWEHTLGVLFACAPLLFVAKELCGRNRLFTAIALGALAGLGVFFRPEAAIVAVSAVLVMLFALRGGRKLRVATFGLGFIVALALFCAANQHFYGHVFGAHSLQVLDRGLLSAARLRSYAEIGGGLLARLAVSWPLGLFALLAAPLAWRLPNEMRKCALACVAILVVSAVVMPGLLPNAGGKQWGPRYWLVLAPWAAVALGFLVEALWSVRSRWTKAVLLSVGGAALLYGAYFNGVKGTRSLADDYDRRVWPAVKLIKARPERFVLVSHQWIAQELAALADDKTFLLVKDGSAMQRARRRLQRLGVSEALLVVYRRNELPRALKPLGGSRSYSVYLLRIGPRRSAGSG